MIKNQSSLDKKAEESAKQHAGGFHEFAKEHAKAFKLGYMRRLEELMKAQSDAADAVTELSYYRGALEDLRECDPVSADWFDRFLEKRGLSKLRERISK